MTRAGERLTVLAFAAVVLLLISFAVLLGIGTLRWYLTRHDRG